MVGIGAARCEDGPVTLLRGMKAAAVCYGLLFVAFNANRGFAATWSRYQIGMRFFFIFGCIDTSMAINTSDLAMVGLRKILSVD
jgi:hypothetical protein